MVRHSLVFAALFAVSANAQSPDIRGVWKPVEVVVMAGTDSGTHTSDVQPGLLIFTDRHYSTTYIEGFIARPMMSATATDEERVRIWRPFVGSAGTYVVKDSMLSTTASVAKNPAAMSGRTATVQVRVLADSLWLIVREAGAAREAGGIERRIKCVRVERIPSK